MKVKYISNQRNQKDQSNGNSKKNSNYRNIQIKKK
jgi:hypothetical protein